MLHLPIQGVISGGGEAGAYWDNVSYVYEFDGDTADSSGYLKDEVGGFHLSTVGALTTKTTGVLGDARQSLINSNDSGAMKSPTDAGFDNLVNDFTVMGWVKPTTKALGYLWAISQFGHEAGYSMCMYEDTNGARLVVQIKRPSGSRYLTYSCTPNTWYHMAVTTDKAQTKATLHINGAEVYARGDVDEQYLSTSHRIGFLAANTSYGGGGDVDAFRFWKNEALTLEQIQGHYNGGAGVPYPTP